MEKNEREILDAIHELDNKVTKLETKIDDSVSGRFKDNERRIGNLETNQRWVVISIIGIVLTAVMNLILK
jgi:hypothetical protein